MILLSSASISITLASTVAGPLELGIIPYLIDTIGCPLLVIVYRRESIDRYYRLITNYVCPVSAQRHQ